MGQYVLELGMVSEPDIWFDVQRFPVKIVGSCYFEDIINKPLKFIQIPPHIGITPDRPSYFVGEIARVRLSIANGTIPRNLKLSVFLRHPDGHLRSLNSSAEMLSNPPCSELMRMGAPHILSREFRIDWQLGLQLRNMPEGVHILYALMTEMGITEVVSKSSSIFYLSPNSPEENTGNVMN